MKSKNPELNSINPAFNFIVEDATDFIKHAKNPTAAKNLQSMLSKASAIVSAEGVHANRLISLGFWIHQRMIETMDKYKQGSVITAKYAEKHIAGQVLGGIKGNKILNGSKAEKDTRKQSRINLVESFMKTGMNITDARTAAAERLGMSYKQIERTTKELSKHK